MVGQPALPVRRDEVALVVQHLHIADLVEGHDVGLETFQDGAGLLRRTLVRLVDDNLLAIVGRGPVADESRVEVCKEFPRHVDGRVEDFAIGGVQEHRDEREEQVEEAETTHVEWILERGGVRRSGRLSDLGGG